MVCKKCGREINEGTICQDCENNKNLIDKKYLKMFCIFLVVVIIGVTIFFVIKRNHDIDNATTIPKIPNQAGYINRFKK